MGYTSDLVLGLTDLLVDAGLGVYREDTPYGPDDSAIVHRSMPDQPDRVICLTPYPVDDDVTTDAVTAVQIRVRAGTDPLAVLDLGDAVLALLHNRRGYALRSVRVAVSWRQSEVLLGEDAHGRDERTHNFYFQTTRPSPHAYE
ncbi:minor capsid protein [Streptomyces sp. NPDC004031]